MQPYLQYLPVPTIDTAECNSTKHYNGQIDEGKICAGYTDTEKSPCYVSFVLLIKFHIYLYRFRMCNETMLLDGKDNINEK